MAATEGKPDELAGSGVEEVVLPSGQRVLVQRRLAEPVSEPVGELIAPSVVAPTVPLVPVVPLVAVEPKAAKAEIPAPAVKFLAPTGKSMARRRLAVRLRRTIRGARLVPSEIRNIGDSDVRAGTGLVVVPANLPPAGVVSGAITARDGVRLRYARFPASARPIRGTVVLVQGRCEFIEKYFETARDLGRRGFAVAMVDLRGQGLSQRLVLGRRTGHVDDFGEYLFDIEALMRQVVLPDCPPPYFLLGHSMGGLIATAAAAARPNWFERVVLSAPLFAAAPRGQGRFAGPVAAGARFLDTLGMGSYRLGAGRDGHLRPFRANPFTSDAARYRRVSDTLRAEPALTVGAPSVGWICAALRATSHAMASASDMPVPVLAIAAGADHIVGNAAIQHYGRLVPVGGTVTIANAQHELLIERDVFRDLFWAAFDEFVPGSSPLGLSAA